MSANIKTWQERMAGGSYLGMGCYVSGTDTVKTGYTGVRAQIAARDAEIADLRAALADANRKNLELTRVNHEQRLQEKRLEQALAATNNGWAHSGPASGTKSCVSPLGKGICGGPEGGPELAAKDVPDGWQPIETAPKDGYMLVHEDGAIRALMRVNGEWKQTAYPAIISLPFGDVIVGEGANRMLPTGYKLAIRDGCCENPTHWMQLPAAPSPADQKG